MKKFNATKFIKDFSAISHRQGVQETKAAKYLLRILRDYKISFKTESFITYIPKFISANLKADNKKIPVRASSMVSGKISGKYNMASSLIPARRFTEDANIINFNPYCHAISQANYYYVPSVNVEVKHIPKILKAKKVQGDVSVKKMRHTSMNILIGNQSNPKTIVFAHYDSIGPGSVDDASGISLLLKMMIEFPLTLTSTLFVLAGNEELSYDRPIYWGHGYRVFEKKHLKILDTCKKIICVDCVGSSKPVIYRDAATVKQGIPFTRFDRWLSKMSMLSAQYDSVMEIYHSDIDTWQKVNARHLQDCFKTLTTLIS